jgi:hypothetical protein
MQQIEEINDIKRTFARRNIHINNRQIVNAILVPDDVDVDDSFPNEFKNRSRLLDFPISGKLGAGKKTKKKGKKRRKR